MKHYKLKAVSKEQGTVKTAKKEFMVPYFETMFEGPIISVEDNQDKELYDFLYKFNGFTEEYQIATELIHLRERKEE